MDAEIIAVGSELLLGQIVNSNAQFLSTQLAELGINVYFHTVVGDNPERLKNAIQIAQSRSNLIIFTGGLGPTKDDLTKETIASLLDRKLIIDHIALKSIEDYFLKTNRIMTENNKKQAIVLEGSDIFPNNHGMAPGMGLEISGVTYMLFPGPPKEMKPMFLDFGRSFLLKKLDSSEKIVSRVLRFFGIGESKLETEIMDLIDNQTNPTIAPYAGDSEVTLRLTAKHSNEKIANQLLNEIEEKIQMRVGKFFYGYGDTSLVKELMKLLIEKGITISSAESLTGGMFGQELTGIAGASSVYKGGVICYSNRIKEKVLMVDTEVLENDGAVSANCARLLAENVRKQFETDIGISFTGVAGPSEVEGKPVGTVYIGLACKGMETEVIPLQLAGTRQAIRIRTVKHGFSAVLQHIKEENS